MKSTLIGISLTLTSVVSLAVAPAYAQQTHCSESFNGTRYCTTYPDYENGASKHEVPKQTTCYENSWTKTMTCY